MSARQTKSTGPDLKAVVAEFDEQFKKAQEDLGRFNLAIFGKTGAGKSTLINAVFGERVAPTGIGDSQTKKPKYYAVPDRPLGIWDSKGVEVGDGSAQALESFRELIHERRQRPVADQIHVIWYCVRAADLRLEKGQQEFIRELAKEGIPILCVLTQVGLREGAQVNPKVLELVDHIVSCKLPIAPRKDKVFLTMADSDEHEGYIAHGLEDLLDATFQVAPDGVKAALAAAQVIDVELKDREARKLLKGAAASAAAVGATPIPFADAAMLVPIQIALMAKISAIFGLQTDKGQLSTLAGAALTAGGATAAGKYVVTSLLKLVPGGNVAAGVIRAGVASSLTYAVGEAWIAVCVQLHQRGPDALANLANDQMRDLFIAEFKRRTAKGR